MSLFTELKRRNVIRVAIAYIAGAWLLTEVSGTLFPAFEVPDWGVRFVVIVLALGFIPALIISWAYELTPEGLKREKDVVRDASITHLTAKRLDVITIGLIVVALTFIVMDRVWLSPKLAVQPTPATEDSVQKVQASEYEPQSPPNSIAVLPFVNMSSDPEQEYFSDGISEELLNLLAKVPELRVISRSSAFYFKGKDFKTSDIARELNVSHVLEGSVRKSGEHVRITAQLIEANSDSHVWSESYDRTLNDIFTIQDEIAAAVVAQLKLTFLGVPPQSEVVDPKAYTLYLQAVYVGAQFGPDSMEQSNAMLSKALAIEPNFAKAWRLMARNIAQQTNQGVIPKAKGDRLARQAIEHALTIDPDLAVAHSWLAAKTASQLNADLVSAAVRMQRALNLQPTNPDILSHAASFLNTLGRRGEAIAIQEYVVELNPLGPITYNNLGWSYLNAKRPNDALAAAETLRILSPNYGGLDVLEGMALLQIGDHEAAVSAIIKEQRNESWRLVNLVKAYHTAGQADKSEAALTRLIEVYGEDRSFWIASVFAYRSEADPAFEWLEKAVRKEDEALQYLLSNFSFDTIREDPRWLPFLRRIRKSPEQLSAVELKIKLPL